MNALTVAKDCPKYDPTDPANGQKQIYVQLVLSVALGASAFLAFCFLRPRWKSLYQARKRLKDAAQDLPELPDGFLDWVPVLYRVTEQQVLSSAGLDAYVVSEADCPSLLSACPPPPVRASRCARWRADALGQ